MRLRIRRILILTLKLLPVVIIAALNGVPFLTHGPTTIAPQSDEARVLPSPVSQQPRTLKVMTLNIAHGRGDGWHQAFMRAETHRRNLDRIGKVLIRETPDIVALQEADGPSIWSGNFDHVAYVAESSNFRHHFRGEHVKGLKLSYGTALLSRQPLDGCASITFAPSPPTLSKGFVLGTFQWPGKPDLNVTVASVHLDFSRGSIRQRQVKKIVERMQDVEGPVIVMGDFNCEWKSNESTLKTLAEELEIQPYMPFAEDFETFPGSGKRLDWILVSPEIEFVSYTTLDDVVSDHSGVVTVLRLATHLHSD